ncbi:acyl-CoA dehydrogenase family protein [Xaviernesmea oryzae]|uniref:acyl-CoA dehydrogenase family protein n=1 Tax=Xaviernesmea oryzae TaxID=464029 RepID=UPI0008C13A6E|nr:acyl-CoA dehydrogenase family protein [Xaviernesmea oryzae]SEM07440.1 Acyl-CoA dehydrogenase [Xaviernesmea oryzae]
MSIATPSNAEAVSAVVRLLAEAAPEADRSGAFPWAGMRAVHQSGLLESTVATRYGGAGANLAQTARLLAELGRGDPSVALISAMTLFTHLGQAVKGHWPEALYKDLLAQAKHGPLLLNAARVEPELGSPARGGLPATRARRTTHGWSITGRKRFVTGAHGLTHFLVWAHTDEVSARVGTFVVANGLPGITVIDTWNSLGMRASGSHDVVFIDVEVPEDHVIDLTPAGVAEQDNRGHAAITLALTALYVGVAEAAQAAFNRFVHERVPSNLGRPIAQTERILALSGEIDLLIGSARQIIFDALDAPAASAELLIRARLLAGRHLRDAVQNAVRGLGNPGLGAECGLERHFRDIQAVLVHAPQEDTAIALLGRAAFDRWKAEEAIASTPAPYVASPAQPLPSLSQIRPGGDRTAPTKRESVG